MRQTLVALMLAGAVGTVVSAQTRPDPQTLMDVAVAEFEDGRIAESVARFDELVKAAPDVMPRLWQRGIALYYAGRYRDCRLQFEAHRTVNPDDVENAAWHFLCVARAESPERARAALLPVGPDARVPMRQVYDMFRGNVEPATVLAAGNAGPSAEFYAQLYVGLYCEALGDRKRAQSHVTNAAAGRYVKVGGYMHTVATIHLRTFESAFQNFRTSFETHSQSRRSASIGSIREALRAGTRALMRPTTIRMDVQTATSSNVSKR